MYSVRLDPDRNQRISPRIVSGSLSPDIDGHGVRRAAPQTQYAYHMTARRAYPSDLSDARWALIAARLTAWHG